MASSLLQLCSEVEAAVLVARRGLVDRDTMVAREAARVILSAGSKLHARLTTIMQLAEDGYSFGEVDRAIARDRAAKARGEGEVPGQQTITDALDALNPVADGVSQPSAAAAPPKTPARGGRKAKG